jgi:hypothetical protein
MYYVPPGIIRLKDGTEVVLVACSDGAKGNSITNSVVGFAKKTNADGSEQLVYVLFNKDTGIGEEKSPDDKLGDNFVRQYPNVLGGDHDVAAGRTLATWSYSNVFEMPLYTESGKTLVIDPSGGGIKFEAK